MKLEAIEKIEQLVKASLIIHGEGRDYTTAALKPVMYNPKPDPLVVHNLRGFCGFINNDIDRLIESETESHLIVVNSPVSVDLVSALDDDMRRTFLVKAEINKKLKEFPFGTFMSQEEFAIAFRSLFIPAAGDDFEYVLSYVSRLSGGVQIDGDDDGITQRVSVKRGISGALKEQVSLKPVVKLSPYRTFREVTQPQSEFLLRVRLNQNETPMAALFEADGGAWVNEATGNIVDYIQSLVTNIPVIA